jgi:hypothetical protein
MKVVALAAVMVLAAWTTSHRAVQAPRQPPKQTEIWFNPGVGPGPPADPIKFVNSTDAGFAGVLERVSVAFLDDKQEWLFTTMTFRVTETVFSRLTIRSGDRIDVITAGGWYEEAGGRRLATRPDLELQRGGEYFVPFSTERRPGTAWTGKNVLAATDALVYLQNGDVAPVERGSKWPAAILSRAQIRANTSGSSPTRRNLFLATLRSAAQDRR